jgi:hypothetical protein
LPTFERATRIIVDKQQQQHKHIYIYIYIYISLSYIKEVPFVGLIGHDPRWGETLTKIHNGTGGFYVSMDIKFEER